MTDDVYEMDTPSDTEAGGNFLRAEGSYHLIVLDVDTKPVRGGKLMRGFEVKFGVMAGTVDGQKGKELNLLFFDPKIDASEEQQKYKVRDQFRFWLAIGLADKSSKKVSASVNDARGRHCVAKMSLYKEYLQLSFGEIYHVDDQEAAAVPKDEGAIKSLPLDWRRIAAKSERQPSQEAEYSAPSDGNKPSTDIEDL